MGKIRILGLDPGLRHTGYGVIESQDSRLIFVKAGVINVPTEISLPERLAQLHRSVLAIVDEFQPDEAAVEITFSNKNPKTTLILGQARGVVLTAPALRGVPVSEYGANQIKKAVVGVGHADKTQVDMMVHTLLPACGEKLKPDASDALAMAICHAYMRTVSQRMALLKGKWS